MEQRSEFNQNLMDIREKLPAGYIRKLTRGSEAKKACLVRMWQKQSYDSLTASEKKMHAALMKYWGELQEESKQMTEMTAKAAEKARSL